MDLFFAGVPVEPKRRVHFHEFMLEVQRRLHAAAAGGAGEDPLIGWRPSWRRGAGCSASTSSMSSTSPTR